jgi:hypothetical protein
VTVGNSRSDPETNRLDASARATKRSSGIATGVFRDGTLANFSGV